MTASSNQMGLSAPLVFQGTQANSGSMGDSSQGQAQEISRHRGQDLEQDQVDQVDPPEEEGELASEDEDPDLHQGDPNLSLSVGTDSGGTTRF